MKENELIESIMNLYMDAYTINGTKREKITFQTDNDRNVISYSVGDRLYTIESSELSRLELDVNLYMVHHLYDRAFVPLLKIISIRIEDIKKKHCRV